MTELALEKLKYPNGKFLTPELIDHNLIDSWIEVIENFPEQLENRVKNLTVKELNISYRPEGWTIKQVVHHCADSHMNAYIRFKLAMTEDSPIIKPYREDHWAILIDSVDNDISDSLLLIKSLHSKWTKLLGNFSKEDFKRAYIHPEHGKRFHLDEAIGLYAWHSNHHRAHIEQALKYKGDFSTF